MPDAPRIDADEILEGIRGLVEIETPTGDVEGIGRLVTHLEGKFAALGAKVERIPGSGGQGDCLRVRTPWGGEEPGVLVLGHMDTVHPKGTLAERPFRIEGDSAFGPGIFDMKSGVYLAFYVFQHFCRLGRETPLPITFLFNSDEEVGSPSSRSHIEAEARKARYALVVEPTSQSGMVTTARIGSARFAIKITGRAAHSSGGHSEGRSAIKELAHQILVLEDMTDYEREITVNVGIASGGTGVNVVPAEAMAMVDLRVPSAEIAEATISSVLGLKPFDPDVTLEVTGGLSRPPYVKSPEIEALFQHTRALAAEIGFEIADSKSKGGSDANLTAPIVATLDSLGVEGKGAHTDFEQLYISSIEPRARLLFRLFETLS